MRPNALVIVSSLLVTSPTSLSLAQPPASPATLQPAAPAIAPPAPAPAPAPDPAAALIGKPPPPFTVAKWVKGEPLKQFQKGKVYVVDFWATWCGPCKAAIPHLTKLAHEHKDTVEIIGVSISEKQKDAADTAYIHLVEKFVAKMDDRMDYPVAVDTPDKQMHTAWFKPAGTGGIPTAYIIDQNGLVAWVGIGDPRDVERIVGEVLAGTFDIKKEREREAAAEAEAKKRSAADIAAAKGKTDGLYAKYPGYKEAMDRGDQAAALASLDAAFKADPSSEVAAYQWKIMILMQRHKAQGEEVNAYARQLLERYPKNADIVGFVSAVIVTASNDEPGFDKALALRAAQMADTLATPDTRWAQFTKWRLGWAYFHSGDKAKATESMQAALDGAKRLKGKFDFGDLADECEDAIRTFAKPGK